jgi:hypothetical protein
MSYNFFYTFENVSLCLNYEIRSFDDNHPMYKVLVDFISAQGIGDIF